MSAADHDPKGKSMGTSGMTTKKTCTQCHRPVRGVRRSKQYVCANTPAGKGKPCRTRPLRVKDIERQRARRTR